MAHTPQHQMDQEEIKARIEDELGAAGNNSQELANSPLGTLGSRMMLAEQLYPRQKIDPAMASFLFFNNMARAASQPGATVLGSVAQGFEDPAKYLMQVKQDNQAMDLAKAKAVLGTGSSTGVPRDSVQTTQSFLNGTAILTLKNGERVVMRGTEIITDKVEQDKAIKEANDFEVEMKRREAGAGEVGKGITQKALKAFDQVPKIETNIDKLMRARQLVVDEGATSGVIQSQFPAWRASTIELRTLQRELGLDVVGSVTFGALSKGELDLALSTALPTNLDGPDLVEWLDRKVESQRRHLAYIKKAAAYLATDGATLAGWVIELEKNKQERGLTKRDIYLMPFDDLADLTEDQIRSMSSDARDEFNRRFSQTQPIYE
jgi:hypothetical protein